MAYKILKITFKVYIKDQLHYNLNVTMIKIIFT
jgi:hypothetical protein